MLVLTRTDGQSVWIKANGEAYRLTRIADDPTTGGFVFILEIAEFRMRFVVPEEGFFEMNISAFDVRVDVSRQRGHARLSFTAPKAVKIVRNELLMTA